MGSAYTWHLRSLAARMWSGSNLSVEVTAPRGVSRRLCTSCLPASLPVRGADHCGGCVDLNTGRTSRISSPSMSTSAAKYSRTGTLPSTSACSRCWYRSHAVLSGLLRGCGTASGQAVIEQLDELIDVSTGDVHGGEIRMTLPTIRSCRCDPRPVRGAATASPMPHTSPMISCLPFNLPIARANAPGSLQLAARKLCSLSEIENGPGGGSSDRVPPSVEIVRPVSSAATCGLARAEWGCRSRILGRVRTSGTTPF